MKSIFFQPRLILFVFALLALPISCSKDDDSNPDEGGSGETVEVYQSQVVTIELPSEVDADQYEAKLGDTTLPVARFNENTIAFQVPSSYAPGEVEFKLPELDLDIHYTVKETTLTQSADETIAPFLQEVSLVSDEIANEDTEEAEYLRTVITEFNSYYETLSDIDKQGMARYYKANTAIFNDIFHADLNGGRMDEILTWLGKYGVHTVAFGAGVAIVVLAPDPAEKAAGALLAIIAWKKAKGYFGELMNAGLDTVKVGFGSIWSDKNGNATDETITFMSGEPYTATLNMQRRNATAGNQSDSAEGFIKFFNTFDILSEAVNKLNGVIEFVNDHVFFANISLVPVFTMPMESPLMTETAETDSYESLQFSAADPGVTVGNVSFADGEISITLNILNDEDSIETTLNYTYDDEFSHFTGSFPVVVTSACAGSDLAVTATANGNTATATATGGVPPYTYAWSNGMTGATITGLDPGIYIVTATDANGCTALANVQIEESDDSIDLSGTWVMEYVTADCEDMTPGTTSTFIFNENNHTIIFTGGEDEGLPPQPYSINENNLSIMMHDEFSYDCTYWDEEEEDYVSIPTDVIVNWTINQEYNEDTEEFLGNYMYSVSESVSTQCNEGEMNYTCFGTMKIYRQ